MAEHVMAGIGKSDGRGRRGRKFERFGRGAAVVVIADIRQPAVRLSYRREIGERLRLRQPGKAEEVGDEMVVGNRLFAVDAGRIKLFARSLHEPAAGKTAVRTA